MRVKRKLKKRIGVFTAAVMLLSVMTPSCVYAGEEELKGCDADITAAEWDISKDKTATELDENYSSEVTLSLPAADEEISTDMVFVLDKSTSADVEDQAINMLGDIKKQVEGSNAKVNSAVVIFNKEANVQCQMTDLETGYDSIVEAIRSNISSGTNSHAGLIEGNDILASSSTKDSRKHLIFISDGISYIFNETPTAIASEHSENTVFAGPDSWNTKYGSNIPPADWNEWIKQIGEQIAADGAKYEVPYEKSGGNTNYIPYTDREKHAMSVDKALYLTFSEMTKARAAGYNCHVMNATSMMDKIKKDTPYMWGASFMKFIGAEDEPDFSSIEREVLYLLDSGSRVVDIIGQGTEHSKDSKTIKEGYDFQMVKGKENLKLTVGGVEYTVTELGDNKYGFGDATGSRDGTTYPFILTYYPDGSTEQEREHFVWDINVPVKITEPVQLTYLIKLLNPSKEPGEYTDLFTNVSATIYPVDSDGNQLAAEEFPVPEVKYAVTKIPEDDPEIPDDPEVKPVDSGDVEVAAVETGDDNNMLLWIAAGIITLLIISAYPIQRIIRRRASDKQ